ncbi:MAG: hypothetical protein WC696_06825 [Candidatus Methylopumilus sp.]
MITTFEQLIKALEAIALVEPTTKEEYESLESKCWELSEFIRTNHFGNNCPSEIWHYLTDVDIRYKDRDYAKLTTPKFLAALHTWHEYEKFKESLQQSNPMSASLNNKIIFKVYRPFYSLLFVTAGAMFGGGVFFVLSMGLGITTGVVAMCAKAPIWWIIIFLLGFVFGFFTSAYYSGRWAFRHYRKACNI